ncbi:kinase-like domain-containing protein [Pelagophyceae sp. CCMP2097]|nr:kinase-like domain-containing protein [Pelagophyceae sp. CCMP2097]|mmetsp:Transcript_252/g.914  ORF Transcript_252/g.914 Transcript_252/m.914 type:complete len:626 (+) Transcript_252:116-1993(+)
MRAVFAMAQMIELLARWLRAQRGLSEGDVAAVRVTQKGLTPVDGGWAVASQSVTLTSRSAPGAERAARLRGELVWATQKLQQDMSDADWESCLPQITSLLLDCAPGRWHPCADALTMRMLDSVTLELRRTLLERCARSSQLGLQACWLIQDAMEQGDSWAAALSRDCWAASSSGDGAEAARDSATFVAMLTSLSEQLAKVDRSKRREKWLLQPQLAPINDWLVPKGGVWIPMYSLYSAKTLKILSIDIKSCEVMPSRARAPTLLFCEAVEADTEGERSRVESLNVDAVADDAAAAAAKTPGHERRAAYGPGPVAPLALSPFAAQQAEGRELLRSRLLRRLYAPFADWAERTAWLQQGSPFSGRPGWRVAAFLVKADDDLRQEQLAMQFVRLCADIFAGAGIEDAWLRPYAISGAGRRAGLVEALADAKSVDFVKQQLEDVLGSTSLPTYFSLAHGAPGTATHAAAARNFATSLASYSLLCYVLDVKDRHNGNILLDQAGHVIHIDFGYMLGGSPGGLNFETAPFKLTDEYVDILGGIGSPNWDVFAVTFARGLHALGAKVNVLKALLELSGPSQAAEALAERFRDLDGDPRTTARVAARLIHASAGSERTKRYDTFQWFQNRIQI